MFQSTLPARGATRLRDKFSPFEKGFNPRSPRGERLAVISLCRMVSGFNPRSPRGERLTAASTPARQRMFQSTLPARGATYNVDYLQTGYHVSIHAPREGSDLIFIGYVIGGITFQSTLPARGATRRG